jgi:muramoyltetrapeptide carboxypeptidase LdcA involved in peptidoglycan recycling
MLTQLRRSGYLDGVAGVICGTFTDCGSREVIQDILTGRMGGLRVPMIARADVGHGGRFQVRIARITLVIIGSVNSPADVSGRSWR